MSMDEIDDSPRFWFVAHVTEPLGWCNENGWVCPSNEPVEVFTDEEKATHNLPIDGRWVEWQD